ncbi:unnamed protein product, partial [Prorocentrum cordatum]
QPWLQGRAASCRARGLDRPAPARLADWMPLLTLYVGPGCSLCRSARFWLRRLANRVPGTRLQEVDVTTREALLQAYGHQLPVVCVDGEEVSLLRLDTPAIREALEAAVATAPAPE